MHDSAYHLIQMDTRASLQALVNTLPLLPADAIDSMLQSLDMLLEFGDPALRPWAADAIRTAAQSAAQPGAKQKLLDVAAAVAAGRKTAPPPVPFFYEPPVSHFAVGPEGEEPEAERDPETASAAATRTPKSAAKPPRKPSKLAEFKSLNIRKASVVTLGGFKPSFDPLATKFGFKPVARPGEMWPQADGKPMLFVCQLNLTAAPVVPKTLEGLKLLTFFLDFSGRSDGDGDTSWRFELRTYDSLDGLTPLEPPPGVPSLHKGFECKWEAVDDYPCHEDPDAQNPRDLDTSELELSNAARTKIGGWPSLIQAELAWQLSDHPAKPVYAFQINSEEKAALVFGDNGTLYLARGTAPAHENDWFLDWHCF